MNVWKAHVLQLFMLNPVSNNPCPHVVWTIILCPIKTCLRNINCILQNQVLLLVLELQNTLHMYIIIITTIYSIGVNFKPAFKYPMVSWHPLQKTWKIINAEQSNVAYKTNMAVIIYSNFPIRRINTVHKIYWYQTNSQIV